MYICESHYASHYSYDSFFLITVYIYIALFAAKERLHDFYHCSPVLKTMRTLMLTETANSHTNRDIRNYVTRLLHMTRMAKVEEVRQA